jgi:hypothetical protein
MVKEETKRPAVPGTDLMKPLADRDIVMRDVLGKREIVRIWREERRKGTSGTFGW